MRSSWSRSPSSCRTASASMRRSTGRVRVIQIPNQPPSAHQQGPLIWKSQVHQESSTGMTTITTCSAISNGKTNKAGSLYIQAYYNKSDLSDPMTATHLQHGQLYHMPGGLQSHGETLKFGRQRRDVHLLQRQPSADLVSSFAYAPPMRYQPLSRTTMTSRTRRCLTHSLGGAGQGRLAILRTRATPNQNAFLQCRGLRERDEDPTCSQAGDKVVVAVRVQERRRSSPLSADGKAGGDSAAPITMTRGEAEAAGIPATASRTRQRQTPRPPRMSPRWRMLPPIRPTLPARRIRPRRSTKG